MLSKNILPARLPRKQRTIKLILTQAGHVVRGTWHSWYPPTVGAILCWLLDYCPNISRAKQRIYLQNVCRIVLWETHWKPIFECYTKYLNNFKDHLMLIEPDKCENCNQFTKHSIFSVLISLYSFQNALISCFHWVKCSTPWGVQEIYITFQSNIKTQNTQINRHKAFTWSCPILASFNLVSRINLWNCFLEISESYIDWKSLGFSINIRFISNHLIPPIKNFTIKGEKFVED